MIHLISILSQPTTEYMRAIVNQAVLPVNPIYFDSPYLESIVAKFSSI